MARKNIFQLVEENYDIQTEIRKINRLFSEKQYFNQGAFFEFSFKQIVKQFLFSDWKYRGTCISLEEYFKRAEADIIITEVSDEDTVINNLEVIQ